ncbi:hypothetical protein F2Q69_00048215 [Brassica cretica]|uniref:Uncharacterized protein n=1 Tax=Brassica cretica TaxID=69181 RepID=A0A8S9PI84_BRACR|nr:hypothetical protein F2Q69_00048215 [Brassica cretica]
MKWVRYGLRETASKGRRECMDSCRIDVSEELGRYVATELGSSSVATSDRARRTLIRYVETELGSSSVATCFAMLQGISLSPAFGKHSGLTTDVRSQNCCSCLDLICDRGVRTKGSRKFVPGKRHPPIPCFVWCWPSEISFVSI